MIKNKIFNRKKAFTLAEIMITLVIMGTLLAATIPTMIITTNKDGFVNGLKKAYGLLNIATNQIMTKNAGTLTIAFSNASTTRTLYGNILEFNKTCAAAAVTGNCWSSSTYKLSGGAAVEGFNANNYEGAVLADGMLLLFSNGAAGCNAANLSQNLPYAAPFIWCRNIIVDVNGFKGPNTFGRDMFIFLLGSNGLYAGGDPHTVYNDQSVECSASQAAKNGYGCASKVLNEGKMNY